MRKISKLFLLSTLTTIFFTSCTGIPKTNTLGGKVFRMDVYTINSENVEEPCFIGRSGPVPAFLEIANGNYKIYTIDPDMGECITEFGKYDVFEIDQNKYRIHAEGMNPNNGQKRKKQYMFLQFSDGVLNLTSEKTCNFVYKTLSFICRPNSQMSAIEDPKYFAKECHQTYHVDFELVDSMDY